MGYDITIKRNGMAVELDRPHQIRGGQYAVGGSKELYLYITYNYAEWISDVVKGSHGKTVKEAWQKVMDRLGDLTGDPDPDDYWKPTEGNAKDALESFRQLLELASDGDIVDVG